MGGGPGHDAVIPVRVTARAARDAVGPWQHGRLEVCVSAPPVDGRANDALCRLLAGALDVAPSRVCVVRGARGREKSVRIVGLPPADARRRLGRPDTV